jgi:hypothetical protein
LSAAILSAVSALCGTVRSLLSSSVLSTSKNKYFPIPVKYIIKKAAALLEKVGISLDTSSGELELLVDTDIFKHVTNRNAGRKAQSLRIDGQFAEITVAEVRSMISEIGSDTTAEYLGVSRRNLFYRLKAAEESHYDFLL